MEKKKPHTVTLWSEKKNEAKIITPVFNQIEAAHIKCYTKCKC